jgi:hypothetical protein
MRSKFGADGESFFDSPLFLPVERFYWAKSARIVGKGPTAQREGPAPLPY